MTAEIENLILEHLHAIRADLSDVKERVTQVEINLASLGQQVGALTTAVYPGKSDTDAPRRRLERIEHRLDPTDA